MPIKGIDYDKCSMCLQCIKDCPVSCFSLDEKQGRVIYDKLQPCILCGHCIAICPRDAILYKKLRGESITFENIENLDKLIPFETINRFLQAKRSLRQFKKKKIPKSLMEKVLTAMSHAPTATNTRSLKCKIISDENKIKELSKGILNELVNDPEIPGLYKKVLTRRSELGKDIIFYEAPHVLILHSNNISDEVNATIAITYGMLVAQTLGMGSCWIALAKGALIRNKKMRTEMAGIPDKILGIFVMGYPLVNYFRTPPRPALKIEGLEELE